MNDNYYPITFEGDSFVITNNGTAPTPCKITVIPQVDFMNFTISGVSEKPITVSRVMANDVLVIDGEERTVLINDEPAFDKYNGWEFPKLKAGVNEITIPNGAHTQISIEYSLRYL